MSDAAANWGRAVGVVVPTRNSARTLEACLRSLRAQLVAPVVAVVDNHSTDATLAIAHRLADVVEVFGPERSAQRNRGAELLASAEIVGFVDSDMVLEPGVVAQVLATVREGAGAVIVPEQTMGAGWVARVRAFERAQYVGASRVEAPRFFSAPVWRALGGFDETLDAGEDWDVSLRAHALGIEAARIQAHLWHDESHVGYFEHCAKKGRYALGLQRFITKHGAEGRAVLLDRPYLRRPWGLLRHPLLGAGLVTLKAGEVAAVAAGMLKRFRRSPLGTLSEQADR